MAPTETTLPESAPSAPPAATQVPLLVSLPSMPQDALQQTLANLRQAFPHTALTVASPDIQPETATSTSEDLRLVPSTPAAPSSSSWLPRAADYLEASELLRRHSAAAVLLLGLDSQTLDSQTLDSQTLTPPALHALAAAVLPTLTAAPADLAVPLYDLPPRAGLVNSAILYPISRALFAARPRFPLPVDLAFSARMAERLAAAAHRFTSTNQPDALLWPVSEAAVAGFTIAEVPTGPRTLPQPPNSDLNAILAQIAGSLFADVDAKAAWWQRARPLQPTRPASTPIPPDPSEDLQPQIASLIDSFRLAHSNLTEIWSLVLPPQSLFGLKRLAAADPSTFRLQDSLWARIVYDFLLAYRLRTINRGHLLGAFTPLYLAWVASHLLLTTTGTPEDRHIESVAAAFESDKPYLVSRWRWPDRFNP